MKNPQEVLEQLRDALATTLDAVVQLAPGTMTASGWRVWVTAPGETPLAMTFEAEGASALAAALGTPGAVAAVLNELCSHVFTTGVSKDQLEIGPAAFVEEPPVQGITVAGLQCARLSAPLAVSVGRQLTASAARGQGRGDRPEAGRLGVLMDIELPMVVRFGCTDMPLKALSNLGPGSLIDLSRAPEDPVDVIVGGRVVAHGEVVVVSGSYGIRIVEVVEGRSRALGVEA